MKARQLLQLGSGAAERRGMDAQTIAICVVPAIGMLSVRAVEAGLSNWLSLALACVAVITLLNRDRFDTIFWRDCIGCNGDGDALVAYRTLRQMERHISARHVLSTVLMCGVLYHLSRSDLEGAAAPTLIACVVRFLKPENGRFVVYFINAVAFELFCWERGGGTNESFLWSPVLILPLWNLMVIGSVSTHAALEMWRLAAVLHFCAIKELRLVVGSLCILMAAYRLLEANQDIRHIAGVRMERRVTECVNRDRKQLIGVLSHEVRNRLDVLTNLVATASATEDRSPPEDCSPPAGVASREATVSSELLVHQSVMLQNSVSVVLDLLEIELPRTVVELSTDEASQPDVGSSKCASSPAHELALVPVHLGLLIHSAKQLQLQVLRRVPTINTDAPFSIRMHDTLERHDVLANKGRLHWILRHLIANAYGGCGAGANASVHVGVTLSDDQRSLIFEIRNTGEVHSQDALDEALLRHRQATRSHTRRWGGHGLGLRHVAAMLRLLECPPLSLQAKGDTVTARFVFPYRPAPEAHGEAIAAAAAADGGAAAAAATAASLPPATEKAAVGDGPPPTLRSVLVVDDEEFVRMITVMSLGDHRETRDCEVVTAENGEQGIAVYLERRHAEPPEFDLILMDIQMPVLTGDLAVKRLRTLERQHGWPRTCIIARSANTADLDREHYRQCGIDGCIPKAGNVAKQVLDALTIRRQRPDEFVTIDPHL